MLARLGKRRFTKGATVKKGPLVYIVQKRGLILIEALCALSILLVFSGTFLLWQVAIARMQEDAKRRLEAQTYALLYAEKVRAGAIPVGFATNHTPFTITVNPCQDMRRTPKGFLLAYIVVEWQDAHGNHQTYEIITGRVA